MSRPDSTEPEQNPSGHRVPSERLRLEIEILRMETEALKKQDAAESAHTAAAPEAETKPHAPPDAPQCNGTEPPSDEA